MTVATLLVLLRFLTAGLLLLFMGLCFWWLYQDVQMAADGLNTQQKPRAFLLVISSESKSLTAGDKLPLLGVTSIGRGVSNTIVVDDEYISSEHVLLTWRGNRWWVEDLGSRNGTLLNGQPLTAPAVITTSDVIGIGSTQLKIEG